MPLQSPPLEHQHTPARTVLFHAPWAAVVFVCHLGSVAPCVDAPLAPARLLVFLSTSVRFFAPFFGCSSSALSCSLVMYVMWVWWTEGRPRERKASWGVRGRVAASSDSHTAVYFGHREVVSLSLSRWLTLHGLDDGWDVVASTALFVPRIRCFFSCVYWRMMRWCLKCVRRRVGRVEWQSQRRRSVASMRGKVAMAVLTDVGATCPPRRSAPSPFPFARCAGAETALEQTDRQYCTS